MTWQGRISFHNVSDRKGKIRILLLEQQPLQQAQ